MALKILKVSINFTVKGDPEDQDDLMHRVYEVLQIAMESEDLDFSVDDDQEDLEMEE